MATVSLIVHEMRADAEQQARALAEWLQERGHKLAILEHNVDELDLDVLVRPAHELAAGAALVVSLGGDGSMLRAIELAAPHATPVLGVNFGQLGYLAEVESHDMIDAVAAALDGSAQIEERMRVAVHVQRADGTCTEAGHALNEALIERDESGRTVRLGVSIDDKFFMSYSADGVIVASPTGSTAYSLSARGPIVAPGHKAFIVTPVSPHQLFDRSLVLDPDSRVEIEVLPNRDASLSLDGRSVVQLHPGDRVICTQSDVPGRIVSLSAPDFLTVLKAKFGLVDR